MPTLAWSTGRRRSFGVTLGVVALGFLIFFLGLKFLPLRPAEEASPSK